MQGYWLILGTEPTDTVAQATYVKLWQPIAERYGATVTALDARSVLREARGATRALVVAFASYEQAQACYDDPAYQAAMVFALKASQRELLILKGTPPLA